MLNKFMYVLVKYPGYLLTIGLLISGFGIYSLIYTPHNKVDKQEVVEIQKTQAEIDAEFWGKVKILSNDEVISETQKCKDAGLAYQTWGYFEDSQPVHGVTQVICITDTSSTTTDK